MRDPVSIDSEDETEARTVAKSVRRREAPIASAPWPLKPPMPAPSANFLPGSTGGDERCAAVDGNAVVDGGRVPGDGRSFSRLYPGLSAWKHRPGRRSSAMISIPAGQLVRIFPVRGRP